MKCGNAEVTMTVMPKVGSDRQLKVIIMDHSGLKGIARQEMQVALLGTLIQEHFACRIGRYCVKFFPVTKQEREIAEWAGFDSCGRKNTDGMALLVDGGWSAAAQMMQTAIQRRMT